MTEGAQVGTSVLQVSAHDKDLGLNGEVCADLLVFLGIESAINTEFNNACAVCCL